jgi:nitrogen-specific signal transduction histidine kinase
MNRTLCQWLGIKGQDSKQGQYLENIFNPFPETLIFIRETMTRPPRRYEKTIKINFQDYKRNIQLIIEPLPLKNRGKPFWLVTFVDKSFDQEIMQAKTWSKMAQKTAHDIKNPLSAIMLKLQHLQILFQERSPQSAEEFDAHFMRIIERIDYLRRISKNFMRFVNIETLNRTDTDINRFLDETVKIIQPGLPPDIQLCFKVDASDLPMIKVDQEAMRSVVENLVSNAVNALMEGGKITLATHFMPGLSFNHNGNIAKDYVLIEVMDTGKGIAPSDLEHLFEPNFTRTEGGNGLGLAFVKKTIDDHGGVIEVESEPGAGTAFCIYVPMV